MADNFKRDVKEHVMALVNSYIDFPIVQNMVNRVLGELTYDHPEYEWMFQTNKPNTIARITFIDEKGLATVMVFGDKNHSTPEQLIRSSSDLMNIVDKGSVQIEEREDDSSPITLH